MIDAKNEKLIPISEAGKFLPKQPSPPTLRRWIKRGCFGVRLETCFVGYRRFTSEQAISRFVEATTRAADVAHADNVTPALSPS